MAPSAAVSIFSIIFASTAVLAQNASYVSADCECITGWTATELDCTAASTAQSIELLQKFLAMPSLDCMNSCASDFECQQAFSLLSQYYQSCPLGTVSQELLRSYWTSANCAHCHTVSSYTDPSNGLCSATDCDPASIYGSIDSLSSSSSCMNATECTTQCAGDWLAVSSFSRRCTDALAEPYSSDIDSIYAQENMAECQRDCNVIAVSDDAQGMDANCSSSVNANYSSQLATAGKLDLESIKQRTMLCFYGLNVNDVTSYDLVCIERTEMNSTGIISYSTTSTSTNDSFWSEFGIAWDMDQLWVLLCGALVFFMQTGFTLLEAGTVKAGNVQNILFKNTMDACIGCLIFWVIGYCVAYGDADSPDANGFIGVEDILIESRDYNSWFFQWAFAATAATIVSGAVAERCSIEGYFIYTMVISGWIYPVVVHWVWSSTGWISAFNENPKIYAGAIDFAGSGVVHMVGGFCGLMGAFSLGPRFRRLWFGWYGFNAGSTLAAQGAMEIASKVAVTTTLAAASGGITCAVLAKVFQHKWHIPRVCNGILAALVSITASCSVVSPGVSIAIGVIGGLVYYGASNLVERYQVDDPLDAFAVHGCGGMWGVLSAGIFGTSKNVEFAGYSEALWGDTMHIERFGTQIVLVIVIALWTIVNAGLLFGFLNWMGILRVSEDMERSGIDLHEHGGSAINMKSPYYTKRAKSKKDVQKSFADNKEEERGGRTPAAMKQTGIEEIEEKEERA